jgi:hypothetical protein
LLRFDMVRETLKVVALLTMTIDHIGAVIYPEYEVFRYIGRLSFPLFCYLLVLGMESTRSPTRYIGNLLLFALVSQVPYFLAFGFQPLEQLNIFFTLALGLLFLSLVFPLSNRSLLALIPLVLSVVLNVDYGIYGITVIGCMYLLRRDVKLALLLLIPLNVFYLIAWSPQILSLLAIPVIYLHNNGILKKQVEIDEKSALFPVVKYFFYIYYPVHLIILYLIKP